MTETPETPQQWPPGTRRKKRRVERPVTTVIDGRPSTRMVTEDVWVAVPPRDWDEVIRRGATAVAVGVTVLAVVGTAASIGGLLSRLLHPGIAYAVGVVFTAGWLVCLGIEHIERVDADRAARARGLGWFLLLLGMGGVITYGAVLHQVPAGVVGSFLDLSAKGLWWLIMGLDRVKLSPDVAHWVADCEQEMAGRHLLGIRLTRLNRRAVQMRAAGGPEFRAAEAILAQAGGHAPQLPASDLSGQAVPVSASAPEQAQAPVSGPVPDPSGPAPGAPTPPPAAPTPPPAAATPPPAVAAQPPAAPAPPAPPVPPAGSGTSGSSQQQAAQGQGGGPGLQPVGPLSIAAAVRQARGEDPQQSDAQMVARVLMLRGGDDGGDRLKFTDTVTRTRRRQDNPPARKKNRSA
ncbi:hypothetical protein [Streptomyces sp. NPDC086782]|uniref:hypothetical protein n=1 Tax=Streptomyces sp. NPDC086782 TaxID=3365757 RepID=UPI00380161B9